MHFWAVALISGFIGFVAGVFVVSLCVAAGRG